MAAWIAAGVMVVVLVCAIMLYNNLVSLKHNLAKAWANIDVLLKQRHDELPKLIETCRQYRDFESTTLQRVVEARSLVFDAREREDLQALGMAEGALRAGMEKLYAVAEAYPELRTSEQFMQLQSRISGLENAIADRRELYNDTVSIHNARVEQFPDVLLARLLGLNVRPPLAFEEYEKADVEMRGLFKS